MRIRGDILHPVSNGYICPKGAAMGRLHSESLPGAQSCLPHACG